MLPSGSGFCWCLIWPGQDGICHAASAFRFMVSCLSPSMRSVSPQRLGDRTFLSEVPLLRKFIVTFPARLPSFAPKKPRGAETSRAWSEAPKQPRSGAEWGEAGECLRGREPPSHSAPDFVEASRAPQAELLNLHPARKSVRSRFFFHVVTTRSCGGCDLGARGRCCRAPALP